MLNDTEEVGNNPLEGQDSNNLCPICNQLGKKVKSITVKNLVLENLIDMIDNENYFLCMNSQCDISYYNSKGHKLNRIELKVPLWYKQEATPKYACYCGNVTFNDVFNEMIKSTILSGIIIFY